MDDRPQKKEKDLKYDEMPYSIKKEYYFISTLSSSITNSSEIWLVDSDSSRHMIGYESTLTNLS